MSEAQASIGVDDRPGENSCVPIGPRSRAWETVVAFALIALVGLFFGLPSLPEPFGVDQGIYAYIAERLLDGAVDHRDVFDHKPPGIHAAYAAALALFGHRMWSVRLLDLLAAIATAWAFYALGRRWAGLRMGLFCGLLYVAYYEAFFDWMSRAQPETWVNLTFVVGLALVAGTRRWFAMLAAGVLLGAGFWFKPTIIVLALLWLVVPAGRTAGNPDGGRKQFALNLLFVAAGALAVSALVLIHYAVNGALRDLYEAVVVFNARYHSHLDLVRGWPQVWKAIRFILEPLYAVTVLLLAAVSVAVLRGRRRLALLGFGWLLLAFATVFWQGSFAKGHYVLVLAPMVFLASLALDSAIQAVVGFKRNETGKRAILTTAVVLAFCLLLLNAVGLFRDRWTKFSALASGRVSPKQYYMTFWLKGAPGRGGYSFEDLRQMGAYLEEQTSPDETIYVWGFRPLIAYLARRPMPTRFIFRYPLTRTNDPRWWEEFLSDLDRSPPAYFIVVLHDRGRYHPDDSKKTLETNRDLSRFLDERYEFDRTMTDFEIYRLRVRTRQ
ncbi:hypothetical protein AMJ85_04145 [candidate division BRC1 bacterium SM23_51]|nr:MAG: hypothetical protein AMJ85_04145 [candidate division BRC1 bacterium SM23_51]